MDYLDSFHLGFRSSHWLELVALSHKLWLRQNVLALLDLSEIFNSINHAILLDQLGGRRHSVVLVHQFQSLVIREERSYPWHLLCGVLHRVQCPLLSPLPSPLLFNMKPLGEIIHHQEVWHHQYMMISNYISLPLTN